MLKSYNSKVVISGSIIEFYDYEENILEGFDIKEHHDCGRNHEAKEEDKKTNREKVLNRARRDLRRLVNTNIKDYSKFITLTFADNIQDFEVANYEFKKFRQRLERYLKRKIEYVCVPEFQKRGAIHFHVVMFNVPYIKHKDLSDLWSNGFVRINRIDSVDNVGAYICKYMSKDFDTDERLKGKKCYFTSRKLDKPVEIKEKELIENLANSLPADSLVYENTFDNDFNKTRYKQYNIKRSKIEDVI